MSCEQPCWESINDVFEFLKAKKGSRPFKQEGTVGLFMLLQAPTSIPHGLNLAAVVLLGQKSAQAANLGCTLLLCLASGCASKK